MKRAIEILRNARLEQERFQTIDRKWLESTPSAKIREMLETNIEYRQEVIDDVDDAIETLEGDK
jgi:hypothetical protein